MGGDYLNERIKEVRLSLGLSQDEFGRRLGVTRGAITNIELNKVTPKPLFVNLICREFHVNEVWLRTGEGDMFTPQTRETELSDFLADMLNEAPDFRHRLISVLSRLSTDEWELLERMAQKLVEEEQKEKAGP